MTECAQCHEGVKTVDDLKNVRMVSSAKDYDGDGDVKEGMAKEIEGLQAILYAEIQKYAKDKAGAGIAYDRGDLSVLPAGRRWRRQGRRE